MIDVRDIKRLYEIFKDDGIEAIEVQNGEDRLSLTLGEPLTASGAKSKEVVSSGKKSIARNKKSLSGKDSTSAPDKSKKEPGSIINTLPPQDLAKDVTSPRAAEEIKQQPGIFELKSSWVGFFTRMNPKTGESYIKLRDVIKKGDLVGHVRVLGILQDLKSEVEGKVKEILVEEGQPIEYGQPVMRFELQ